MLRAWDSLTEREVVIKRPRDDSRLSMDELQDRFQREQQLLSDLNHPNIVEIVEINQHDGSPYLATEFVEGQDLRSRLAKQPALSLAEAEHILAGICAAVSHLHSLGILHRDLQPGNILLGSDGEVRVTDFGIAVAVDDLGQMTQTGQILGTADYMSPEQRHRLPVDHRSDQYSIAALAYEMLTSHRATGLFPPPSETNPHVSEALDAVVMRALSRDADDRFDSVDLFFEHLSAAFDANRAEIGPRRLRTALTVIAACCLGGLAVLAWSQDPPRPPARASGNANTTDQAAPDLPETVSNVVPITADDPLAELFAQRQTTNEAPPLLDSVDAELPEGEVARFQQAWAAHLGLPVEIVNTLGMRFRLIPPGRFPMGSSSEETTSALLAVQRNHAFWGERFQQETPRHAVRVSRPFYISTHEVRVRDYASFADAEAYLTTAEATGEGGRRRFKSGGGLDPSLSWKTNWFEQTPDHPVSQLSLADCRLFCRWLADREGLTCRLPTEAEWEYSCRAGSHGWFHFPDDPEQLDQYAWFGYGSGDHQHAVMLKKPNALGLFDMLGNVWERVADRYQPDFYASESEPTDPVCRESDLEIFVHRGSSVGHPPHEVRCAIRNWNNPNWYSARLGFRVILEIPE